MPSHRTLLPFGGALLLAQAPAQDKPPGQPIRDVTVEYKVQVADDPSEPTRERPLNVSLCVSNDGVILRAERYDEQHRGDIVATSVTYGPRPASVFAPPPDFRRLNLLKRRPG